MNCLTVQNRQWLDMSLSDHSAPGSNVAFGFQFERALYWLAQSGSGALVGIETDDDVALRKADNTVVLEQDKHSILEDAKPFGDRSKDLWNTLAIWIDALEDREVPSDKTKFWMVTNKVLSECIAKKISRAKTSDEIAACIKELEVAAKNPPDSLATKMDRVLRANSRQFLATLIANCELADGDVPAGGSNLKKETIALFPIPGWCSAQGDSIFNELLGWLHTSASTLWKENKPAWISRDHFVNQFQATIDNRKRRINRERAEHLIPVPDEKVGKEKARPFVKQLYLVSDDDTLADTAIREFIRCNIEKSRLSVEGNITDDDWLAFESALLSRWKKIWARMLRMKNDKPHKDVGFEIFSETTENYREKLAGSDTEQVYLTSGTYHRLADLIRVGWHPNYVELMGKESSGND